LNQKELKNKLELLLRGREIYTAAELVKMGLYGGKSSVWNLVLKGHLECLEVSERRRVITKESIIKHILNLNEDLQ